MTCGEEILVEEGRSHTLYDRDAMFLRAVGRLGTAAAPAELGAILRACVVEVLGCPFSQTGRKAASVCVHVYVMGRGGGACDKQAGAFHPLCNIVGVQLLSALRPTGRWLLCTEAGQESRQ